MSAAGEFIDATLQRESSWERADADLARLGGSLTFYGASVGAVRGTIRDAGRRYPGLGHDEITALCSELWALPVFERRLAAVVLLQSHVQILRASDLTRIEGFLRTAQVPALLDPLTADVVRPLIDALAGPARGRAQIVLDRWAQEPSAELRRAAGLLGVAGGAA
ncbi:DNA alkylation repair protein [Cryobacterium adonitolivorans]|uniref:DNA alkylation repair protein n=1 Tax=Cryobacterium adonitolivorans TaxID=1259189 RepID=A0A4R8WCK0_9MICO|nr:DNA alkylation repair protein [Cryobacterium adonitolivorans]TFC07013.1 DNA alkylation repair protein [Cryobacterium adonitolivorans]